MGSSLARKSSRGGYAYREGYLRSPAWQKFRREYFEAVKATGTVPVCQVCFRPGTEGNPLDLHHMTYENVRRTPIGGWVSAEKRADVVLICREHHQRLHQILDDYRRDYRGWSRRRASVRIIHHLRAHHSKGTLA